MPTRVVTGLIRDANGEPWPDFTLAFTVSPSTYRPDAHYPYQTVRVTADADGSFEAELVTNVRYLLDLETAFQRRGSSTGYPGESKNIPLVVPDGDGPIALETIRALGSVDPDDPSVADIITNAINEYMANNGVDDAINTINAHVVDTNNPHGVTAGQVGLGNVANLAPADLPVSDATQDALNLKADTSSLGTAAAANVGDFATAAQGGKADTAVQPSAELTDAIDKRHEHTNKAVLDTVATSTLVPPGGLRGQVLTMGETGRTWQDVPGIVYPSLLLSPDGSYDQNGPVTPTVDSGVEIVEGQYGDAWRSSGASDRIRVIDGMFVSETSGTIIARLNPYAGGTVYPVIIPYNNTNGQNLSIGRHNNGGVFGYVGYTQFTGSSTHQWPLGTPATICVRYDAGGTISLFRDGISLPLSSSVRGEFTQGLIGLEIRPDGIMDVESIIASPEALSDAEIHRISTMPEAWTMENTAANLYQPQSAFQLFAPNRAIASGGTTLRTAPGASAPTITTLAASTLVDSSGTVVNSGGVGYTLIRTRGGHQGYVASTALVAL